MRKTPSLGNHRPTNKLNWPTKKIGVVVRGNDICGSGYIHFSLGGQWSISWLSTNCHLLSYGIPV